MSTRARVTLSRTLTSALAIALSASLFACSQKSNSAPKSAADGEKDATAELPDLEGESGPTMARQSPRRVGDIWVHRFSGSYRHSDLILREEVIAKKDDTLIVDFILSENGEETHLRAVMATPSERILSVAHIIDGEAIEATIEDFEKMLDKTSFVPDQNAGQIAGKSETCLVGKDELDCDLAEYKVYLGQQEATLTVARSEEMKRDISGEIVAVDGTVLYHAELIEMQRGEAASSSTDEEVALKSVDFESRD
jgi:hypothetical protein